MDIIFKKVIKNIPDDDYYINFTTILLMLANSFEKEIKPTEHVNNMLGFMDIYISHLEGDKNRFSYNIVRNNKGLLSKARGIKDRFYSLFSSLETASDLVEFNIIDAELSLLCKSIGLIFDSEEMLLTSMTDNIKIFERDIIELAAIYFIHNNNQNKIESAKFILYGLHLRYVIKGYKDIKEFYFKNNKENLFLELRKYENDAKRLAKENLSLKRRIEVLEHDNNKLRDEYKNTIEKENVILLRKLKKANADIEVLKKENNNFKDLIDSFYSIDTIDLGLEDEKKFDFSRIRAVFVGGHSNIHNKLKSILPSNFVYIEGDNEGFDDNLLNNKDFIFIYTKYMSHGFYYKVMEKCKKTKVSIHYISSTSPEHIKKEICSFIKLKD